MNRLFILLLALCVLLPVEARRKKERRKVVRIETTMGTIRVALFDETPIHRDNFLKLTREGFYDGLLFHRVIADFMIQAGDPDSRTAQPGVLLGDGDCDYSLPAEFALPDLYHWRGALAAAREPDDVNPEQRSSACQFYIVWGKKQRPAELKRASALLEERGAELTPDMRLDYEMRGGAPHLDGAYTVYGEVIEGLDVVRTIQTVSTDTNDRPLEDIRILKARVE